MKLPLVILAFVAIAVMLASCGAPTPAPAAPKPSPAPAPTTPAPQAPTGAREIYATNCAACHGAKREGVTNLGPALTPQRLASASEAMLKATIASGKTGTAMPSWSSKLTDAQIDSLVQFIKTVQP